MTRASFMGVHGGVYSYYAELRPWIWLLTRTNDCKIFQKKSVWDIINAVFKDHEFTALEDKRQNQAGSTVLEYCVQYRESAFDFVTRLMEQYGIYYYFTHSDGEHKLVLADDPGSHTSIGAALPFTMGQSEQRAVEDHVWEWTSHLDLRSGAHAHRDYNFTTPAADLTAKSLKPGEHEHGKFEIFDYPGEYETVDDGQKLADVRMQEYKALLQVFEGHSNSRKIRCGAKLSLKDTDDTTLEQEYLVISAVSTLGLSDAKSDSRGQLMDSHKVQFSAIPGTTPFRLAQTTEKPMIRGAQTAKVVGQSGEEISTDEYGRIKVKFPWDRAEGEDENSSCWIRVAQTWAGAGWGSMFIPRIGMEVVVIFLEGNPDRPLVTGVVYNATQTVPYPLPDNMTRSTVKSNSSKGGGGFNELRFEDKKDSEEIFIQAQKDFKKIVLHDDTIEIKNDHSMTVKEGKHETTVSKGAQSITVSEGDQTTTISKGKQGTTVSAGNHTLDVTAGSSKTTTGQSFEVTASTEIKLTATTSITLTVGGNSIKIDPSGVTITGTMIEGKASGTMKMDGGGMMTLKGGIININ
jgi:type VI secretion system secreted protein VgrG